MSLDLMRAGWPNMAAVMCLAMMPFLSMVPAVTAPAAIAVEQTDDIQLAALVPDRNEQD